MKTTNKPENRATLGTPRESDIQSHRKENHFFKELAVIDAKTGHSVISLRFYAPGYTVYAVVWTHFPESKKHPSGYYTRGSASAGGYGYCKQSASAGSAIREAGIHLARSINGVGMDAVRDALHAVAYAYNPRKKWIIHEAHA